MLRGGGWDAERADCRSAWRTLCHPVYRYHNYGFRVVVVAAGVD